MKTSNEWIRDIHEKADKRFAEQKRKRKLIIKASSSAACLALVLCSAVAVSNLVGDKAHTAVSPQGSESAQAPTPTPSGNNAAESEQSDNPTVVTPSAESPNYDGDIKKLFAANKITGKISGALKYRDPKEHYEEFWTEAQISEYLGIDLTALSRYMPEDFAYSQRDGFRILFHNSGEVAEDYQAFVYEGDNNRKVTVLVGKAMRPYDCEYELETNDTTLVGGKGGCEVLFGVQSNFEFMYADFDDGGLHYRIEADNLMPIEIYRITEAIIKLK